MVTHGSVIVALPTIAEHFRTDLPTAQWIVIGEILTIVALLLPMGRLSDIIGRRQIYIAGLIIFVLGAALAGFSTNMTTLILSRVLQGCGAAMTQGTGMAMIISAFPNSERGKALGLNMSVVGSGGVAGPALGGFLVGTLGWRWVFFISVPVGLLAVAAALFILDSRRFLQDRRQHGFDWPGAALQAGMLVAFVMTMASGPRIGWTSPPIIASGLSFVILLSAFIWWELRTPVPLLDLRLFKLKLFTLGVSAGFIAFLGMSSIRFLMPFYLQAVLGYSPFQIGLIMVPNALCMIIMGPISGFLSDRYGWRKFNVGGLLLSAAGLFLLSRVTETSPLGLAMAGMILQSSGMGMFNSPNHSSVLSAVEQNRYGVVSSLLNLVRNSANITSIALAIAVVTAVMASMGHPPSLGAVSDATNTGVFQAFTSGLRTTYLVMGSLLLVGVLASVFKGGQLKESPTQQAGRPQGVESPPD